MTDRDFKRFLIVDDNSVTRDLIASYLYAAGHRSYEAENGVDAIEVLKEKPINHYDAIILDYHMQEMNGEEFLVKVNEEAMNIPPVMLLTGDGAPDLEERAQELHIACFVLKPIDPKKLFKYLSVAVGEELKPPNRRDV